MFNKKICVSGLIFFLILLIFTSFIKNETRLLEKKIYNLNHKISKLRHELHDAKVEYSYLSSPKYLFNKLSEFSSEKYVPRSFSEIYLSLSDLLEHQYQKTKINVYYDEEKNKKVEYLIKISKVFIFKIFIVPQKVIKVS